MLLRGTYNPETHTFSIRIKGTEAKLVLKGPGLRARRETLDSWLEGIDKEIIVWKTLPEGLTGYPANIYKRVSKDES